MEGGNEIEGLGGIGQEGCSGRGLSDQVFSINCGGWPGRAENQAGLCPQPAWLSEQASKRLMGRGQRCFKVQW